MARWDDIDAMAVGLTVWRLGAGRSVPGERVQSGAGLRIHRRPASPSPLVRRCSPSTPTPRSGSRPRMAELDGALERRRRRCRNIGR